MALVFVLAFDRGFLAKFFQTQLMLQLGEWSYAIYIGQTPVLQLLRHAQMHLYPAPTAIVFGRTWAAWAPVWHWLEPTLLVCVAGAWGWVLFTLIEKPANTALRKWFRAARAKRDARPATLDPSRLRHHSPACHTHLEETFP